MCPRDYAVWMRDVHANEYNVQKNRKALIVRRIEDENDKRKNQHYFGAERMDGTYLASVI